MKYDPTPDRPTPEGADKRIFEDAIRNPNVTPRPYDNSRFGASHGSRGTDEEQGGPIHSIEAALGYDARERGYDASGDPYGAEGEPHLEESVEVVREDQRKFGGRGRHPMVPTHYGAEQNQANDLWVKEEEEETDREGY